MERLAGRSLTELQHTTHGAALEIQSNSRDQLTIVRPATVRIRLDLMMCPTDGLLIGCWVIAFVRVAIHLSSIGVLSTVDVPIHGDDRHDESHEYESPFSTQSSTPLAICS